MLPCIILPSELWSGKRSALGEIWHLFPGPHPHKLTTNSVGSSMLREGAEAGVREGATLSPVLTHEQQGQAIEESANVSQEPHQDCKLENEMTITTSHTVTEESHFIDFFLD